MVVERNGVRVEVDGGKELYLKRGVGVGSGEKCENSIGVFSKVDTEGGLYMGVAIQGREGGTGLERRDR